MTTKLAYVFPGQGSQFVGMLKELAERFFLIKDQFNQVSDRLGYDLWQLVQEGPESKLNQTEHTQVAMLTADVALYYLMKKLGLGPAKMMAGHSLGEYAALVSAEAISLSDAAFLVTKRGELMQKALPLGKGAMAAIVGLSNEEVESACIKASSEEFQVSPANYNAIGQVVIAGHSSAVKMAIQFAEELGARLAKLIPVSVPCHCSLLKDSADAFEEYLAAANFKTPNTVVVSNVDLTIYKTATEIRSLLKKQLYRPVRWIETVQLMKKNGIDYIIESGPGRVLTGLIKRIDRDMRVVAVDNLTNIRQVEIELGV